MKDDKFLLILLVLLGFVSLLILKPFLTYILFSLVITVVTYPLYVKIKSKIGFAPLSAIILIFFIVLIIIVPSIFLTITVFTQARDIITDLGATAEFKGLQTIEKKLEDYLGMQLSFASVTRVWFLDFSSNIRAFITENIITLTRTIANFLAGVVLMFIIMFYLFIDGKRIIEQIKVNLLIEEKYTNYLFTRTYRTIQGLFLGLFLTAVLQGVVAGIGYFIFGVPGAILFGFLTGVLSLIPFLGPPIVYIPISLFLFSQGNLFGGFGLLLLGILLISNIDNFFRPWIVRFRSKIHPLYVILGVVGGVALLGFIGIVIGPLILSLFQEVLEVYRLSKKSRH